MNSALELTSGGRRLLIGLAALFAVSYLFPYLTTGYYQDDSINSLLPGELKRLGLSYWPVTLGHIRQWVTESGRVYPLSAVISNAVFAFVPNLMIYRLLQVGATLLCLVLFFKLVYEVCYSFETALFASVFVLPCFQLRDHFDPIASYGLLLQAICVFGFGSAWLFLHYLKSSKLLDLILSLFLYSFCLLTYEVGLVFFPALALLVYFQCPNNERKIFIPYVLVTALYLATTFYVRHHFALGYSGTRVHLSFKSVTAYFFQTTAALPLIYPIFGRSGFYKFQAFKSMNWLSFCGMIFGGLVFVTALELGSRLFSSLHLNHQKIRPLFWLGVVLAVFPPIFIAVSERFSDAIGRPGHAYLPVFLSSFGVGLLIFLWVRRFKHHQICAWGFAAAATLEFVTNSMASQQMNRFWKYPRLMIENALHAGLLDKIKNGSWVVHDTPYYWFSDGLIYQESGRKIHTQYLDYFFRDHNAVEGFNSVPENVYFLRFDSTGRNSGTIDLVPMKNFSWDSAQARARQFEPSASGRHIVMSEGRFFERTLDLNSGIWEIHHPQQ